jgi:hypothetical protein
MLLSSEGTLRPEFAGCQGGKCSPPTPVHLNHAGPWCRRPGSSLNIWSSEATANAPHVELEGLVGEAHAGFGEVVLKAATPCQGGIFAEGRGRPDAQKPKEGPPREGFFEREQFEPVRRRLVPDLQVALTIAYTYGWRTQSEVLQLERRHVDLNAGTLRLDPGMTKNDDGRVIYLTSELKAMLAAQVKRVEVLQARLGRIIPWLFPHDGKGSRAGEPRRDFRKAWKTAYKAAGVAGRIRHDFRRTAVRNMVNAGVPERVAMTMTGHKTRSVFEPLPHREPRRSPGSRPTAHGHNSGTIALPGS